ncbi:MAG: MFS transporter [Chitinophagaceae bacterium]
MNITTFSSFRSRNFRLFFYGQGLSLVGTWMQKTAVSWVIYSITQSKFMLGLTVFATLFPTAVFSLLGGIAADRYNRHKLLLLTQVLSLVQALLLTAAIVFFREEAVVLVIILSAVLGTINGYDIPARQSLVRELVLDERNLPNALALNSSMVNLSKLIGPTIAGFAIEHLGDKVCFGLNALSFIPVIISLLAMRLPKPESQPKKERNMLREFKESFAYIKHTPSIKTVIILVGAMSFFALPFSTLTPAFAKDIFHGTASTFGVIDGFIGLGAFVGAIFLASLKEGANLAKVLAINAGIFGVGLVVFSFCESLPLALFVIAVSAFGMMSIVTVSNTLIQMNVPALLRGRVISVFIMVFSGMLPLGSLLVGGVSHYIGVQQTVLWEGVLGFIIAMIYGRYLRKTKLRATETECMENQPEGLLTQA